MRKNSVLVSVREVELEWSTSTCLTKWSSILEEHERIAPLEGTATTKAVGRVVWIVTVIKSLPEFGVR